MELSPYQRILLDRAVNLAPPQERDKARVQNLPRRLDFNTDELAKFLAGEISRLTLREFKARERREQRCKHAKGAREAFGVEWPSAPVWPPQIPHAPTGAQPKQSKRTLRRENLRRLTRRRR
jgi:hypothetical protein